MHSLLFCPAEVNWVMSFTLNLWPRFLQGVPAQDLKFKRVLFGGFPCWCVHVTPAYLRGVIHAVFLPEPLSAKKILHSMHLPAKVWKTTFSWTT